MKQLSLSLLYLHPNNMKIDMEKFIDEMEKVQLKYKSMSSMDDFLAEASLWYDVWSKSYNNDIQLIDLLKHSKTFYSSVGTALTIALAFPVSACTSERSCSTSRRVKTWLRSTMGNERLSSLCMLSVY